jgi:hypothetical protein
MCGHVVNAEEPTLRLIVRMFAANAFTPSVFVVTNGWHLDLYELY